MSTDTPFHAAPGANATRRALLGLFLAGISGALPAAAATAPSADDGSDSERSPTRKDHFPFGYLSKPRPIPAWPVVTHVGDRTDLARLLRGQVTAVQLMFTSCSASCPIQGALFRQAQGETAKRGLAARFVSLSVDPKRDGPAALAAWMQKFHPLPGWIAVAPGAGDVEAVFDLLTRGGEARPSDNDPHSGQIYLISRSGNLVYRTPSMPTPTQIADAIAQVARLP